jgi:DeoR family fructose operon transcriptional repressor
MLAEKRSRYILEKIEEKGSISIPEIASKCNVSNITVRRDLLELEEKGLLIRTHGGAVKPNIIINGLFNFEKKISRNKEKKEYICKAASELINDGDVIFIDCGSTPYYLSKFITKKNNLRVITNSLPVVSELINFPQITVILIGGEVEPERKAIYGYNAEKHIEEFHVQKAFIGADGVSIKGGLSSYDGKEAAITKKMAGSADQVILLCDSSKIEKDCMIKFAPLSIVDYLVTDKELDTALVKNYEKQKVKVIL